MFIIGERKISKAIQIAKDTGVESAIAFRRGDIRGNVTIEPYNGVIGISLSLSCRTLPDILEVNYTDITELDNKQATVSAIQNKLPLLYRLGEIGLYTQFGIWENPLPKETTMEQIQEYFNISDTQLQEARREDYKHGKIKLSLKGIYYGERLITVIQSKRTGYVSNIFNIE